MDDSSVSLGGEIARLTENGVLGFFTHFEVTEIVAFKDKGAPPCNVFSILVAEERTGTPSSDTKFLGPRITLKGAKGSTFGICRYVRSMAEVAGVIAVFEAGGKWQPSGNTLDVGTLFAAQPQFVPADSSGTAAWNGVLKNNFWGGSHVVELADPDKAELKLFFENPTLLQELSERIQEHVPIRLGSLSDRLGNVVFQVPVKVLSAEFEHLRSSGDVTVSIGWHPKATPRKLRAVCDMQFDEALTGYASADVEGENATIPVASSVGDLRAALWDDERQILVAAKGSTSFIRTIVMNTYMMDPEPREFTIPGSDKSTPPVRIATSRSGKVVAGTPAQKGKLPEDWARRRIYRDETQRLSRERRFVQYRPSGAKADAHEGALKDLHFLLRSHGQNGAWLWDPYLTATDLIETLFYCPHGGVELRALTAGSDTPEDHFETAESLTRREGFAARQRTVFDELKSNWHGIRLEYRIRSGSSGWPFHDRFLIFPVEEGGAFAWSLGTSVNSYGTIHHILQKVDDGQRVMDAFVELWDMLDQPQDLIVKRP